VSWLEGGVPAEQFAQLQQQAAAENAAAQEAFGIQARNLERMAGEGVLIALGSDGNTPWAPHQEMEDMVIAGMTPANVLVAATGRGAEFLRLDEAGTIEAGKSADFIVLEANPLDDITNTRRIVSVYMRGDEVNRSAGAAAAE
jgi:imidazolonepropionase-like amidohydrolase